MGPRIEEWGEENVLAVVQAVRADTGHAGAVLFTGSYCHGRRPDLGHTPPKDLDVLLIDPSLPPEGIVRVHPDHMVRTSALVGTTVDTFYCAPLRHDDGPKIWFDPDTMRIYGREEGEAYTGSFLRFGTEWRRIVKKDQSLTFKWHGPWRVLEQE